MSGDVTSLAAEMTPYVSVAVGAYGGTVLVRARDEAADATVRLGRRLLEQVFGMRSKNGALPLSLADLAADPSDLDALAAVRLAVLAVGFQGPHHLCALCKATDSELIDWAFVREYGFMLSNLVNYFQIFGFPAAIVALILGWRQLQSAARTSRVQMLLALDTMLSDFEDVRGKINELDPDINSVRLRRYIAVFERVGLALRYKQITPEQVDQFYGQRFVNLMKLRETREIVKNRDGWTDFYYLWEKLRGYDGYDEKLPKL